MASSKSAGTVQVTLAVNATSYSAAIDKAKAKLNELGDAGVKAGQHTVSGAAAASGALRGIEGAIPIRAAEKFLSMLPGMGAALQAAFPIIGALAVAEVIARGAGELLKFKKKTEEAGEQFRLSFQQMSNASRLSNDQLAKSNIELENQIAKLTGKHENVLANQLIDARIEADNLASSAAEAAKQVQELLDRNKATFLNKLMGSDSTDEVFGTIQQFANDKRDIRQRQSDAEHNGDKAGAEQAKKDYAAKLQAESDYYKAQIRLRTSSSAVTSVDSEGNTSTQNLTYAQQHGDQSKILTAIRGAQELNYDERDRSDLAAQHTKDVDAKTRADNAKRALEQAKQSTQRLMEQYRQELTQLQGSLTPLADEEQAAFHTRELTEEAMFWAEKLSITKQGTEAYKLIQKQLAEVDIKANQQAAAAQQEALRLEEQRQKLIEEITASSAQDLSRSSDTTTDLRGEGRTAQEYLQGLNESVAIARQNADTQREAALSIGLATGQLSQLDAAQLKAALHADQFARSYEELQDALVAIQNNPAFSELEKQQQSRAVQNRIDSLTGNRTVQAAEDVANINANTTSGTLRTALNQYVQQSRESATLVRDIWSSALSGINDQFARMMTGQRTSWKQMFSGVAGDLSKAFLQKAEGTLMGALGFGKPDGSESNPFSVKVVGGKSAAGGLSSIFAGLGGDGANPAGIGSTLLSAFIPGFASGGDPPINAPSIIGENGPELFIPKAAGTIVPNHALGGDTHIHLGGIDARGATDPAAIEAAVNRSLTKHAPALIAASMHAQRESAVRKPASSRR